jgi:hypothetical protein
VGYVARVSEDERQDLRVLLTILEEVDPWLDIAASGGVHVGLLAVFLFLAASP